MLALLLFSSANITVFAASGSQGGVYLEQAESLKKLGLFQGGANGFELNRKPTRAEGAVMLVRMLGKEEEAKQGEYSIPFKDVPSWAVQAVAYLYNQQLASGISADKYGSTQHLTAAQYATMLLRTLGYSDKAGDFQWNLAIDKILSLGMVTDEQAKGLKNNSFLRDHVVLLSYQSLLQNTKGGEHTLAEFLVEEGAFTREAAESAGAILPPPVRLHDPRGVRILRTTYGSLDIFLRSKELESPLDKAASIAIKSFDQLDEYKKTVSQIENNSLEYFTFLAENELKTTDTTSTKFYKYPLIKGAWSRSSTDPQLLFSYVLVFYDQNKRPIAYIHEELPEIEDEVKKSSETVKVTEKQRITSGITIKIKSMDEGENGRLKNDPITNLVMTVDPKALPAFLTVDRSYGMYYMKEIYGASPTNLGENGVPKHLLTPRGHFGNSAFGGQGSFKYIAVVIFDEDLNIVAFYETTTQ